MKSVLNSRIVRFLPAVAAGTPFMPCCVNYATGAHLPMLCCQFGNQLMMCCQRFFG